MVLRLPSSCLILLALAGCGGGAGGDALPAEPTPSKPANVVPDLGRTRLVTLIGDRDSAGLHWIIAGDGFTAEQLPELREAAGDLAREMLEAPDLVAHTSVWNVHVLEAVSRDAGVDDATKGTYVDTAFNGRLGCGSNSRVACVDWEKIDTALRAQGAPAAQITVLLNTSEYVGSSNTSGIIVSRNVHAPRVAVHEMGHRVAGLADEYVDALVADEWRPFYFEGRFPNVTTVTETSQVPWRHWLSDSEAGIGLYEGAFYVSSGFYRPKQDSFMRTLEAPIGQVNAEAWLRAQYRALPPLSGVLPSLTQVQGLAGETLEFSVVSAWPREAVSLRWFVDGVEDTDARDASSYRFATDGGVHEVGIQARDITGRIRAPDAHEAESAHTWRVTPDAPGGVGKGSIRYAAASWLRIRTDGTGHSLLGRETAGPAARIQVHEEADWQYTLLAEDDSVLATGRIADPRIVRSTLSAPGEPQAGHAMTVLESGHYLIGVPPGTEPRKLRIAATAAGMEKLGSRGLAPGAAIEISLDAP